MNDETRDVTSPSRPAELTSAPASRKRRSWFRRIFLIVVPLLVVVVAVFIYASGGRYVDTENAYVKARLHALASEVSGRVLKLHARENQNVRKGDLVLELDAEPFHVKLAAAEAELAVVQQRLRAGIAAYHQAAVDLDLAREAIRYFANQLKREKSLPGKGIEKANRVDNYDYQLRRARQQLRQAEERRKTLLAELGGNIDRALISHPRVRQVQARIDAVKIDLARTKAYAPADGIIARIAAEPGEIIDARKTFALLVDGSDVWIEANLKETQLTYVKAGQKARFTVDAYPDRVWHAKVASIAPATGAEFALLPAQNASGNWVKVVQRLPVRLRVDHSENTPVLRAGMTVSISIDTERQRQMPGLVTKVLAFARGLSDGNPADNKPKAQ